MTDAERLRLLTEFAEAHERWEANLVIDGDWGPIGMHPYPRLTAALYDEALQVQALRNRALGRHER